MQIQDWKRAAAASLRDDTGSVRRLELVYTGTLVGSWLAIGLVEWLLTLAVQDAGGIGGLGIQTLMSTITAALRVLLLALLPFWKAGRDHAMLEAARGKPVAIRQLLLGTDRWKPILIACLLLGLRFGIVAFLASYLAEQIFLFTPLAGPVYVAAMEGGDIEAAMAELTGPYLLILLPVFLLLALPLFYRYRMVSFLIMDQEVGGLQALIGSQSMTRYRCLQLARLDLSFWWYHLPVLTGIGLMLLPVLLPVFQIGLPIPAAVCLLVGAVLVLGMDALFGHRVRVILAHCYEDYSATEPQPKKKPFLRQEDLPWDGWS